MFTRSAAKKPPVPQANSAQPTGITQTDKTAGSAIERAAPYGFDIGSIPILSPGGRGHLGNGAPLETTLRADMEAHFRRGLGAVRVHTDARAAEAARNAEARAYTVGNDIVFGAGEYAPATPAGRMLLAHELAHTVQQRGGSPAAQAERQDASLEHSADAAALRVAGGVPVGSLPSADLQIARKPAKEETEAEKLARHRFKRPPTKSPRKKTAPGNTKPAVDPAKERAAAVAEAEALVARTSDEDDDTPSKKAPPQPPWAHKYPYQDLAEASSDTGKTPAPAPQDPRVRRAQEKFRKNHKKHSPGNLYNIDRALARVTQNNPDLLIAYYEYYADHGLTDEIDNKKRTGETSSGDTDINEDVLALQSNFPTDDPISLLGGTLVHEFSHTPQGGKKDPVNQAPDEAKAYGIEWFFADRMGDKQRAAVIDGLWRSPIDTSMGTEKIFNASRDTMSDLYKVIDKGGPEAAEARQMSVEFISKNKDDYGPKLKAFIEHRRSP